jgi:hypothetical protein
MKFLRNFFFCCEKNERKSDKDGAKTISQSDIRSKAKKLTVVKSKKK